MRKIMIILVIVLLGIVWYVIANQKNIALENKVYQEDEVEEAISTLNFDFKLPSYMPEGSKAEGAVVYTLAEQMTIVLHYNYDGDNFFEITAFQTEDSLQDFVEVIEEFTWKDIEINGLAALIGESKQIPDKRVLLKTEENIIFEVVSPTLTEEELIRILESI